MSPSRSSDQWRPQSVRNQGLYQPYVPAAQLYGRDDDRARIARWFKRGDRLISIIGPAGVGKSRLALHAAGEIADTAQWPVIILPAASLSASDQILPALASLMELPDDGSTPADRVAAALRQIAPVLVVLDNLEHLVDSAPVVAALLETVPGLQILTTSRIELGIRDERRFDLPPLAVPPPGADRNAIKASAAVQLFVARSSTSAMILSDADLPDVADICRQLVGVPLALELAAAQLSHTGFGELQRLIRVGRDQLDLEQPALDPRQKSLRSSIAISYQLLSAPMQTAFDVLSVFNGGFVLDAAERVLNPDLIATYRTPGIAPLYEADDLESLRSLASAPLPTLRATEVVTQLLELHLLQTSRGTDGDQRYSMLESVRAFGIENLIAKGLESYARLVHAMSTAVWSWTASHRLWDGSARSTEFRRFREDIDNIRSGLEWALAHPDKHGFLANVFATSSWWFWLMTGSPAEGRAWLDRALEIPSSPSWIRAFSLNGLGYVAWVQGDLPASMGASSEVIDVLAPTTAPEYVASGWFNRGLACWKLGDFGQMHYCLATARQLFLDAGQREWAGVGICDLALGVLARASGDPATAHALLKEARHYCDIGGHSWGTSTSFYFEGELFHDEGEPIAAASSIAEGLRRYAELEDTHGAGCSISGLAVMAVERGETDRAARLFGAGFGMLERGGMQLPPVDLERYQSVAAQLGAEASPTEFATGRGWTYERAVTEALAFAADVIANRVPGPVDDPLTERLTADQRDAVNLLVQGQTVDEIATNLNRSKNAIYDRLRRAAANLGVDSETCGQSQRSPSARHLTPAKRPKTRNFSVSLRMNFHHNRGKSVIDLRVRADTSHSALTALSRAPIGQRSSDRRSIGVWS